MELRADFCRLSNVNVFLTSSLQPCFHCRQPGHELSECPVRKAEEEETNICFKCGSEEHTVHQCNEKVEEGAWLVNY